MTVLTIPLASWFVYNQISFVHKNLLNTNFVFFCTQKKLCTTISFPFQGPDDVSAMSPSELILTRGTLNEEEEERDSDTDDIDHEGKRNEA